VIIGSLWWNCRNDKFFVLIGVFLASNVDIYFTFLPPTNLTFGTVFDE
jgi:hypothetical protein